MTRRGFLVGFTSTFTHEDYQGIQLDPLVLPPTTTLIPAIGGAVSSSSGQAIPDLTVSLSQGGTTINTDQTNVIGEYFIQDLAPGSYLEQVTDVSGHVWASQNISVLAGQPTNFIDFTIAGVIKAPATVTLTPATLSQAYDGTPKSATASTSPAGLAVNFTYNGSSTTPTTAGAYAVVGTINDPNYQGTATGTLIIGQSIPVITWPSPAPIMYGTALSATQLDATASVGSVTISLSTAVSESNAGDQVARRTAEASHQNLQQTGGALTPPILSNLAFSSDRTGRFQIWVYQDIPGTASQITFNGGGNQESRNAAWSRTSGKIAYQFGAPGARAIHVINPDGSGDTKVTPDYPSTGNYPCQDDRDPAWSPDGRYIAYACLAAPVSGSSAGGNYQIWLHDNSLGTESLLVGSPQSGPSPVLLLNPAWSPDGASIAFVTGGVGGKSQISIVHLSNGATSCLSNQCSVAALTNANSSVSNPTWSPDSSQIAFSSTRSGGRDIFTMSAQCPENNSGCAPAQQLTAGGGSNTYPSWSPDGSLVFVSTRITNQNPTGRTQLYVIDPSQPEGASNLAVSISDGTASDDDAGLGATGVPGMDISFYETNCPNTTNPYVNAAGLCSYPSGTGQEFDDLESLTPEYWQAVKAAHIQIAVVETYGSTTEAVNAGAVLRAAHNAGLQTAIYCFLDFNESGAENIAERCLKPDVLTSGVPLSFCSSRYRANLSRIPVHGQRQSVNPSEPL